MRKDIPKTMSLASPIAFGSCDFVEDSKEGDDEGAVIGLHVIDEYCSLS